MALDERLADLTGCYLDVFPFFALVFNLYNDRNYTVNKSQMKLINLSIRNLI